MTDFDVYDKKDPNFINDLRESRTAVSISAEWLNRQRIEVKRRKSLTFSSKEDFPYDSLIVDVCHSYDKAKIKPYAYIILNEKMDCAFIAYSKHQKHWKKTVKADRFKGRDREFYECPMEHIKFVKIKE